VAFSISLGLHLLLLIGQFISWNWGAPSRIRRAVEIIYDYEVAKQEVQQLQEQLARAKREAVATPTSVSSGLRAQIRIPDRPSLAAVTSLGDAALVHSSYIDLTNLTEASGGDPVLLTYFGAIREQIQHSANRRAWVTGDDQEGMVYLTFILSANGSAQKISVLSDRSAVSSTLRETALSILEHAAPFPPFPPSMPEASKTIVIPLEFLVGS
jgi:TonB family protein